MKKNSFDPFMINNFSNIIKQNREGSLPTSDIGNNELMGMTFMEKSTSMSIPKVRTGLVLLITSDSLGNSNELGISLIKNFCDSVANGLNLPEYIFLVNQGVKLITDDNLSENFRKIKKYGTNIVLSFESLEYFNLINNVKSFKKWAIGDITTVLLNANKVIKL